MNQFLLELFTRLRSAALLAVLGALLAAGVGAALLVRWRRRGVRPPWGQVLCRVALAAYGVALVALTLLRPQHGGDANWHLLRAWREAWNTFSLRSWANPVGNILLFVPLGLLLPPALPKGAQGWVTLCIGCALTLGIELLQLALHRGIFDVDDLFANAWGTLGGYGLWRALTALHRGGRRRWLRVAGCTAPLWAVALLLGGVCTLYALQPYGNLADAPAYRVPTADVEFQLQCPLPTETPALPVYRATGLDEAACDALALALLQGVGVADALPAEPLYYDSEAWYSDHQSYTLFISFADGAWRYYDHCRPITTPARATRAQLAALLAPYGITLPADATLAYEGDGLHTFTLDSPLAPRCFVRCRYDAGGYLSEVHCALQPYIPCGTAAALSPTQAYERLTRGQFAMGSFHRRLPASMHVLGYTLQYRVDSKGYYQPVYCFAVRCPGDTQARTILIPALA